MPELPPEYFIDPQTGVVYWRDGEILKPRVLTDRDGNVVGVERVAGFWPSGVEEARDD